ncbi:MAG: o-succinylbenzoate synthase [Acidimicrobiia bacterium]
MRIPLVRRFRTAHGAVTHKEALLLHAFTDEADGWAECAAEATPGYSDETLDGARLVLRDHLVPRAFAGADWSGVRDTPFARAALEAALLDAALKAREQSLASYLGAQRIAVEAGVAIGIIDSETELRRLAAGYVAAGYRRIKLKVEPGADVEIVAAVRAEVGDAVTIAADANGSYATSDVVALAKLDAFALQCIEQPLAADALHDHAALAAQITTPIALDESVTSSAVARDAISMGACRIVNIKPGRVGGIAEARRVHDVCVDTATPALIGGMLETGIGRAVNVALAGLPGFTEPGDLSASDRYFVDDVTEPWVLDDGCLRVPDGPGIGVHVRPEVLARFTIARELLQRSDH